MSSMSLVLTVIGPDQPGLVEALSETVALHGGSWENSRMAHLAGSFAGILEVRVPPDRSAALFKALHGLERRGLKVQVEDSAPQAAGGGAGGAPLELQLVGQDRPGIVREVSAALASAGVNVLELETEVRSAPMSGETLFHARALLEQPLSSRVDALREILEKIASELMVDLSLDEPEG